MVSVTLDPDVCGFPGVQLGGYVAAAVLGGRDGAVALRRPVRSGTTLHLDGSRLRDDAGAVLAEVVGAAGTVDVPVPPTAAQLDRCVPVAADDDHPVPGCYACGPAAGRGLGVAVGVVPGRDLVSSRWTPPVAAAGNGGVLDVGLVWAALDCAGFWALTLDPPPVEAVVTARFSATSRHPVRAGRPHVVTAWLLTGEAPADGPRVAAAVHDGEGRLCATAVQQLAAAPWGFPLHAVRRTGGHR